MKSTTGGSSGRGKGIPTTGSTAVGGAATVRKVAQGGAEGDELKNDDPMMDVDLMLTDWDDEEEDADSEDAATFHSSARTLNRHCDPIYAPPCRSCRDSRLQSRVPRSSRPNLHRERSIGVGSQ
eukprot:SAG31_NODE_2879_length_4960_cov_13.684839_2_plen_124_part_00